MLEMLDDYDWKEAFGYAGEPGTSAIPDQDGVKVIATKGRPDTPTDWFTRSNVEKIIRYRVGENEGPSWLMMGRLRDGRYFFLNAGCDYTGWD